MIITLADILRGENINPANCEGKKLLSASELKYTLPAHDHNANCVITIGQDFLIAKGKCFAIAKPEGQNAANHGAEGVVLFGQAIDPDQYVIFDGQLPQNPAKPIQNTFFQGHNDLAIKFVPKTSPLLVADIKNDFTIRQLLSPKATAMIFDTEKESCLVMSRCGDMNLLQYLEKSHNNSQISTDVKIKLILKMMRGCVNAMLKLHPSSDVCVVHNDLKPHNITVDSHLLDPNADSSNVDGQNFLDLVDYSFSFNAASDKDNAKHSNQGTPVYAYLLKNYNLSYVNSPLIHQN